MENETYEIKFTVHTTIDQMDLHSIATELAERLEQDIESLYDQELTADAGTVSVRRKN